MECSKQQKCTSREQKKTRSVSKWLQYWAALSATWFAPWQGAGEKSPRCLLPCLKAPTVWQHKLSGRHRNKQKKPQNSTALRAKRQSRSARLAFPTDPLQSSASTALSEPNEPTGGPCGSPAQHTWNAAGGGEACSARRCLHVTSPSFPNAARRLKPHTAAAALRWRHRTAGGTADSQAMPGAPITRSAAKFALQVTHQATASHPDASADITFCAQ